MSDYRDEIQAIIDPEHTEALLHGGVLQHVTVVMSDPPQVDGHRPPWLEPSVVTLRPREARQLARELLALADQATQARSPA